MSVEQGDARIEYELTICELERHREPWLDAKTQADRAAGLSSTLNTTFEITNRRMNHLLEELFMRMGNIALEGVGDGTRP